MSVRAANVVADDRSARHAQEPINEGAFGIETGRLADGPTRPVDHDARFVARWYVGQHPEDPQRQPSLVLVAGRAPTREREPGSPLRHLALARLVGSAVVDKPKTLIRQVAEDDAHGIHDELGLVMCDSLKSTRTGADGQLVTSVGPSVVHLPDERRNHAAPY